MPGSGFMWPMYFVTRLVSCLRFRLRMIGCTVGQSCRPRHLSDSANVVCSIWCALGGHLDGADLYLLITDPFSSPITKPSPNKLGFAIYYKKISLNHSISCPDSKQ